MSKIEFSDRSKSLRKKVSIFLLIGIIFGYTFISGYMVAVSVSFASASEVQIEIDNLEQNIDEIFERDREPLYCFDPYMGWGYWCSYYYYYDYIDEIEFEGIITIKNIHENSMDIKEIYITMKVYADDFSDDEKVGTFKRYIVIIPRLTKEKVNFKFKFEREEVLDEKITQEEFDNYETTNSLIFEFEVSFSCGLYNVENQFEIEEDIEEITYSEEITYE